MTTLTSPDRTPAAALVRHRHRAGRAAHAGARRHRHERRAPPHPDRPRLLAAGLSWVLNAYTLAFGGLLLLGGRLGDVFGRLRVFVLGLSLFTAASLAAGLAQTPEMLVTAPVLQGVGAAIAAPSVLALLTTSPPTRPSRNRALALFTAVSSAGGSIGLILGGALTDLGSWRWTLVINVPIGIMAIVLVRRFVDETARRPGRFDVLGAATATARLGRRCLCASSTPPDHGWDLDRHDRRLRPRGCPAGSSCAPNAVARTRCCASACFATGLVSGALVVMSLRHRLAVPAVLPARAVRSAHARLRSLRLGFAFLPLSLAIFAVSRISARLVASLRPTPLITTGTVGMAFQLPVAEPAQHDQQRMPARSSARAAESTASASAWCSCRTTVASSRASSPATPVPPRGCCRRCSRSAVRWGLR